MKLFNHLLSLIAPYDCLGCAAEGSLICMACTAGLRPAVPRCYKCQAGAVNFQTCRGCQADSPLHSVIAVIKYEALAKDLIWKLKFGRTQGAAAEIATIVHAKLRLRGRLARQPHTLVMTHAPTATTRIRSRGYDQAALIAQDLARQAHVPYARLLGRSGSIKQVGASRAERVTQLSGVFRPLRVGTIRGAHIILVDDVVTTGATLESAARVLMAAGARRVDAIVFAQA